MKKCFIVLIFLIRFQNIFSYEILDEFLKPFKIEQTKNIMLSGAIVTASMVYIDRDFDKHNQHEISRHNISLKMCHIGNNGAQFIPNLAYTLINATLGITLQNGSNYTKRAIDMFNASIYSGLLTDIIKPIVNQKRPSGGNYSFPSGHTTTAFAFASYVAAEHEWYFGLPAYLCAMSVAYSRVATNFHYPHDVLFGATIGASYGLAQYYKNYLNQISYTPMLLPTETGRGVKLLVTKEF